VVKIPYPYYNNRAVFLDRDGVINKLVNHDGVYTAPWSIKEFEIISGAELAIDVFKESGYNVFVVTNQPDVHDGKLDIKDLANMNIILKMMGVDKVLCSLERGSAWYKPNNGMIETLCKERKIDRSSSYIIGDRWKDIVAGHKSRLMTIFVGKEYTTPEKYNHIQPDYIVDNVLHAATLIMELEKYD
jgi:D-glycero-D-manno-heptose 1,7-bisphosphate phosphatase